TRSPAAATTCATPPGKRYAGPWFGSAAPALAQNLLQRLGELAGLAHETAVIAREHDRIDAELLGEREPGAVGELTLGGRTDTDHDPGLCRFQRLHVGPEGGGLPDQVTEEHLVGLLHPGKLLRCWLPLRCAAASGHA